MFFRLPRDWNRESGERKKRKKDGEVKHNDGPIEWDDGNRGEQRNWNVDGPPYLKALQTIKPTVLSRHLNSQRNGSNKERLRKRNTEAAKEGTGRLQQQVPARKLKNFWRDQHISRFLSAAALPAVRP
ncbi:hypothetical protein MRX96_040910 [Rhipicephalus microplus]